MLIRVPLLLEVSLAVVYRLSPVSTKRLAPNVNIPSGYDSDFRETISYSRQEGDKTVVDTTRVEFPAVRVPCQVETVTAEELKQMPMGDAPYADIRLVFHKSDLLKLKLIREKTNELLIKVNDRITHIESKKNPGKVTHAFNPPGLYIVQVEPGSFGFGTDGFDLYIIYLRDRVKETS